MAAGIPADDRARMEANRQRWDRLVEMHRASAHYDVPGFREGRCSLRSVELGELGDVEGRSLLHLQCHLGLDTLSLARMGARVTGVDFSEPALAAARTLAAEVGLEARFVHSNVYELTRVLHEQFDVVFSSHGVLCWLPDIVGWARVVARFLRPGGTLVLVDDHPAAACVADVDGRLQVVRSPFRRQPLERLDAPSYAEPAAEPPPGRSYQWVWPVASVVSALIDAGLRLEHLRELPIMSWRLFPSMTLDEEGWWRLPGDPLPLLVACRAVKPL